MSDFILESAEARRKAIEKGGSTFWQNSEFISLYRKVCQNPYDYTARDIVADWLEEKGDNDTVAYAQFIRAQRFITEELHKIDINAESAIQYSKAIALANELWTKWCSWWLHRETSGAPTGPNDMISTINHGVPSEWDRYTCILYRRGFGEEVYMSEDGYRSRLFSSSNPQFNALIRSVSSLLDVLRVWDSSIRHPPSYYYTNDFTQHNRTNQHIAIHQIKDVVAKFKTDFLDNFPIQRFRVSGKFPALVRYRSSSTDEWSIGGYAWCRLSRNYDMAVFNTNNMNIGGHNYLVDTARSIQNASLPSFLFDSLRDGWHSSLAPRSVLFYPTWEDAINALSNVIFDLIAGIFPEYANRHIEIKPIGYMPPCFGRVNAA